MSLRSIRKSSVIIRIRNRAVNKFCWQSFFFSLWSTLFSIIDSYSQFISSLNFKCRHERTIPWWSPLPYCVLSQSLSLVWRHVVISSGRHLCALQNSSWHAFSQGSPQPFWVSLLCYFLFFFFFSVAFIRTWPYVLESAYRSVFQTSQGLEELI